MEGDMIGRSTLAAVVAAAVWTGAALAQPAAVDATRGVEPTRGVDAASGGVSEVNVVVGKGDAPDMVSPPSFRGLRLFGEIGDENGAGNDALTPSERAAARRAFSFVDEREPPPLAEIVAAARNGREDVPPPGADGKAVSEWTGMVEGKGEDAAPADHGEPQGGSPVDGWVRGLD
jgi:hypothetical protein